MIAAVDTSALARMHHAPVAARLDPLISADELGVPTVTALEMGWSARSPADWERVAAELAKMPRLAITEEASAHAVELQRRLSAAGKGRAVGLGDLLTAASADLAGVTLVHYDSDFDTVAAVSGLSARWVVPRGTVD